MQRKKECVAMLLAGGQGSRLFALTTNIAKPEYHGIYRMLTGNHAGYIDDKHRSMYSYVEVSADELRVRSYGVSVREVVAEADDMKLAQHTIYVDGFALRK